jgi:hypothetical protein
VLPTDFRPHERPLDRRAALGAFGALGAIALGFPRLAAAATRVPVWRLDAVHRQGKGKYASGAAACRACRRHARNKIFATQSAADGGRAHKGCNCRIVRASLPEATFEKLFGPVGKTNREVVDRRWADVRKVLSTAGSK